MQNFRWASSFVRLKQKNIHLTDFKSNHHNDLHHISVIFSVNLNINSHETIKNRQAGYQS